MNLRPLKPGIAGSLEERRGVHEHASAVRRLNLLSRVSVQLATVKTERELPQRVADSLRALFPDAKRVAVLLTNVSGAAFTRTSAAGGGRELLHLLCAAIHAAPAERRGGVALGEIIPYLVVPNLVPSDRVRQRGPLLSAPLLHDTKLLGLIILEDAAEAPDFTMAELDELSAVAAQVALVLERIRMESRAARQQRLERDLDLARQIQRHFLPALASEIEGLRVAAEYRPAYDVGGDFYDLVPAGDGSVLAVVGDVSGKGVPAALLMSRVSSDFRRLARAGMTPKALLTQLNHLICEQTSDEAFVTAVCMQLDAHRGRAMVANAGHVLPLVRHASGAVLPVCEGDSSGPPLGMVAGQSYDQHSFELNLGDIVLLMTDGVIEALDCDIDRLGTWMLLDLIANAPQDVAEINRRILNEVDQNLGDRRRADDVTLLALEVIASAGSLAA